MSTIDVINFYTAKFGSQDCFKTWVDDINYGEKSVVHCSFRIKSLGRRITVKYQQTIKNCKNNIIMVKI